MAGAEPKLDIHIAEDRRSVTVSFVPAGGGGGGATLTLEQLTSIIQGLGLARQHIASGRPTPPLEGQQVHAVYDANWYVAPDLRHGGSALVFHHPCYGPIAFVVPPDQAGQIARLLTMQSQMASLASPTPN